MGTPEDCLWCGAALSLPIEALNRCPECGRGNRKDDLRVYRTRRPGARRLQSVVQFAAIAMMASGFFWGVAHARKLRHGASSELVATVIGLTFGGMLLAYVSTSITRRREGSLLPGLALSLLVGPVLILTVLGLGASRLPLAVRTGLLVLIAAVAVALAVRVWRRTRR